LTRDPSAPAKLGCALLKIVGLDCNFDMIVCPVLIALSVFFSDFNVGVHA
jgi:hypothetical protein